MLTSAEKMAGCFAIMSDPVLFEAARLRHSSEQWFERGNIYKALQCSLAALAILKDAGRTQIANAVQKRIDEMRARISPAAGGSA